MFESLRSSMADEQILARGIQNRLIAEALRTIPRHEFIQPNYWAEAYEDHPVSIGYGQTISQPYIVAAMLELVQPSKEKRLLEVGSGCGYLLAIASLLFKEVYGIENISELYAASCKNIEKLHLTNVHPMLGDGYEGLSSLPPFDSIIVSCSCPQVPPPLIQQLAPGGILVAPVGDIFLQDLSIVHKQEDGSIKTTSGGGVRFVPLVSLHVPNI
jgi:protein-L-isoaspartate(D-aspartate) O-methyltransferase